MSPDERDRPPTADERGRPPTADERGRPPTADELSLKNPYLPPPYLANLRRERRLARLRAAVDALDALAKEDADFLLTDHPVTYCGLAQVRDRLLAIVERGG